ncbi:MAG: hypothetical protein R3335_09595, partial [Anaerolineales bacterium]|nr:hypothetical protein [Anaerolineales bacterium]
MSNITLREYYQEVETLVAQGRLDEVVAHCRHILKFFPKDVAVYRLLGKSYLESRRLSDATDILQRVLSVVPDDFVSHVGMSLIREDEGNLDAAIWHMERAFEVQPSNSAIRDEVRRLFGKRDGMEPPKIRLTRGALARMYANGNLYQQSISELRSALSEEPQRFDLLVLLARMYYLNGQHVDAAEVCNTLLNKLPFCLDANRILAAVLVNSGRESEAEMYNERLQVLDPYTPHAPPGSLDSDGAQNSAVTLPHLEWEPGQEVPGTDSHPSWASSLGIDIGDSVSEENDVPAWLQDDEAGGESALESAEITEMDILGIPADSEGLESPPEASIDDAGETHETVDATAEAEDLIPDWMKDSGWATAEGEEPSPESTAASEDEEPGESRVDAGVSAPQNGEMPDWLKDMAPDALDSTPEELDLAEEDMSGEIPGWLSSQAPGSTDSVVMWLEEKPDTKNLPKTGPLPSIDPETGEDVPDWLDSVVSSMENSGAADAVDDVDEEAEEASVPGLAAAAGVAAAASSSDWLKGEESAAPIDPEEDTRPRGTGELVAPAVTSGDERPAEDEPDQSFPAESGELSEAAEPFLAEESPVLDEEISGIDWNLGEAEATTAAGPAGEMDTEEDMPEWLTGSGSGEHEVSFEELADQEPSTEEAVPDWLTEMEKEATELSADTGAEVEFGKTEVAEAEFSEIPPWIAEAEQASEDPPAELPDIDSIAASPVDAGTAGHREESGELPSEDDQDAALAWLEGLAMKQGVDEEELVT